MENNRCRHSKGSTLIPKRDSIDLVSQASCGYRKRSVKNNRRMDEKRIRVFFHPERENQLKKKMNGNNNFKSLQCKGLRLFVTQEE